MESAENHNDERSGNLLWRELVCAVAHLEDARRTFMQISQEYGQQATAPLERIRRTLVEAKVDSKYREALEVLAVLKDPKRVDLLPLVVKFCIQFRFAWIAKRVIQSFPKKWIADHFENAAFKIIEKGDDADFSMMIRYCVDFSLPVTAKICKKAALNSDSEIRDIAEHCINNFTEWCKAMREMGIPGA
jgi:hypothetical protein